jgi:hypothetical protein
MIGKPLGKEEVNATVTDASSNETRGGARR